MMIRFKKFNKKYRINFNEHPNLYNNILINLEIGMVKWTITLILM